jgi:pilus assembly protein TadC
VGFYTSGLGLAVAIVGVTLLASGSAVILALVRRVGRPPAPARRGRRLLTGLLLAVVVAVTLHPALAVLAGVAWSIRARRRGAQPPPPPVDLDEAADLTAIALTGGVAPSEALRRAAAVLPGSATELRRLALDLELGPDPAAGGADPLRRLRDVLRLATSVGAPAAPALRRLAHDLRADELARVLAAAERLPAQLTFPTALCLLPATLLLVGAPMVHAGLAAAAT